MSSPTAATWTPTGRMSAYGNLPIGTLATRRGRIIAKSITLEAARNLYPELKIEAA